MKIVFLGHPKYAENYKRALESAGHKFFIITKFENIENELRKISPDLGVIACYGKIIPEQILKILKHGFLNIHPSLLPKWRGPSPVRSAIFAGDAKTGVTVHITMPKVDAGAILFQKEMPIDPEDNYAILEERLFNEGAQILPEIIKKWLNGQIMPQPQDESMATYSKKVRAEDGLIDWSHTADHILRQIQAYSPEPGVYAIVDGKRLKIKKAERIENNQNIPFGTFFETSRWPVAKCADGALRLLVVQPEGKKDMTGDAYLRGHIGNW